MRYLIITLYLCSITLHGQDLQFVKTFYSDVYQANLLAKDNRITPLDYTVTLDRHLFETAGRQIYWTSSFNTNNPNLSKQDMAKVLKLRENIGIFGSYFNFSQDRNSRWRINNSYGNFY